MSMELTSLYWVGIHQCLLFSIHCSPTGWTLSSTQWTTTFQKFGQILHLYRFYPGTAIQGKGVFFIILNEVFLVKFAASLRIKRENAL